MAYPKIFTNIRQDGFEVELHLGVSMGGEADGILIALGYMLEEVKRHICDISLTGIMSYGLGVENYYIEIDDTVYHAMDGREYELNYIVRGTSAYERYVAEDLIRRQLGTLLEALVMKLHMREQSGLIVLR